MSKIIKVGYLTHAMSHGGATISLLLLQKSIHGIREFCKSTIVLVQPNDEIYNEFLKYNDTIKHIDSKFIQNNQVTQTNLFKFFYYRYTLNKELLSLIESHNFDILHINTSVLPHILKPLKKKLKTKIVTHVRELIVDDFLSIRKKYIVSQILKYSDTIIAISDNEAINFKGHNDLHVLPNPFDFSNTSALNTNKFKTEIVKIGMMANLSPAKGNMEFVQALNLILKKYKTKYEFKFYMIGVDLNYKYPLWKLIIKKLLFKRNYYEKIIRFINANKIKDHIVIVPFTLEIIKYLADFDILVRPSLTADPWGRDIIEAMAMKKPVVATGTSQFYVENNKTGYLIPPKNIEKLADRIVDLINNPDKREFFGNNGFEKISKMCDIQLYGINIEGIYKHLLL